MVTGVCCLIRKSSAGTGSGSKGWLERLSCAASHPAGRGLWQQPGAGVSVLAWGDADVLGAGDADVPGVGLKRSDHTEGLTAVGMLLGIPRPGYRP